MKNSAEILKNISEGLAKKSNGKNHSTEKEYLQIVDSALENNEDDFILLALKSELLQDISLDESMKYARLVLSKTIEDDSLEAKIGRGISFYVCALENDRRHNYSSQDETIKFFRLALENYPAHWNTASMFADLVYNDVTFYEEAIKHLETAIGKNENPVIKGNFLSQAAAISHLTRNDSKAVEYYEKCREFITLDEYRLSKLALSYARVRNFRKSFKNFQESWQIELKHVEEERITNPFYVLVNRGYDEPLLYKLTEMVIKSYEDEPTEPNLLLVAMCFYYHPAALARLVLDVVQKQLTGKGEVDRLMDLFGLEKKARSKQGTIPLYNEQSFSDLMTKTINEINRRLLTDQPGSNDPFQI